MSVVHRGESECSSSDERGWGVTCPHCSHGRCGGREKESINKGREGKVPEGMSQQGTKGASQQGPRLRRRSQVDAAQLTDHFPLEDWSPP